MVVVARPLFDRAHTHVVEIHSRLTLRVRRRARPFTRKKSYKTNKRKGHITHMAPWKSKATRDQRIPSLFRPTKKTWPLSHTYAEL